MSKYLKKCWEIRNCELHQKGRLTLIYGECVASKENMGHTCWALSGTFCDGLIQGNASDKERNCQKCEVYQQYHRVDGKQGDLIRKHFPEEEKKYFELIIKRRMEKNEIFNPVKKQAAHRDIGSASFDHQGSHVTV